MQKMLLLALVLLVPGVAAQEFDFTADEHVRVAVGDVPRTNATEPAGVVNTVEYMRFSHDGNQTQFTIPSGAAATGCTCPGFSTSADTITVGNTIEAGEYVFWLRFETTLTTVIDVDLQWATTGKVVVYAPPQFEATGPSTPLVLACDENPCTIYEFNNEPGFWAAVHPQTSTVAPVVTDDSFGILELVVGIGLGALLWFLLVKQGFVQARGRKQVVQASAHQAAAATESKPMLEARKRVLMAGLKDLEKAKMAKEMDDEVYDALKAELKREAVIAMRAMESAE